jgi:hypothetical protein
MLGGAASADTRPCNSYGEEYQTGDEDPVGVMVRSAGNGACMNHAVS